MEDPLKNSKRDMIKNSLNLKLRKNMKHINSSYNNSKYNNKFNNKDTSNSIKIQSNYKNISMKMMMKLTINNKSNSNR